jgi:hypothetical protein
MFLAAFLIAAVLGMRLALLVRDRVKHSHLTVDPPGFRTTQPTQIFQRTQADHSQVIRCLLSMLLFLSLHAAYGVLEIFVATSDNMFPSM